MTFKALIVEKDADADVSVSIQDLTEEQLPAGDVTVAVQYTTVNYKDASVAAVGLAGGAALPASVIPFLLRGVNLLGIDTVLHPFEKRVKAWQRIATDLPLEKLDAMIRPATLAEVPTLASEILKGQIKGRIVVDVNA